MLLLNHVCYFAIIHSHANFALKIQFFVGCGHPKLVQNVIASAYTDEPTDEQTDRSADQQSHRPNQLQKNEPSLLHSIRPLTTVLHINAVRNVRESAFMGPCFLHAYTSHALNSEHHFIPVTLSNLFAETVVWRKLESITVVNWPLRWNKR